MSFAPFSYKGHVLGGFREKSHGHFFEYSNDNETKPFDGYPVKVFVAEGGVYRWAKVLKTVAYVVTDENADGGPVVEKWDIKEHSVY